MKEVVKIEDNIDIINDYCYRYEKILENIQNEVLKKEKESLDKIEKEYETELKEIEKQKKICLLGLRAHIPKLERELEMKKKFCRKSRRKEKKWNALWTSLSARYNKNNYKGRMASKGKKEIENKSLSQSK